MIQHAEEAKKLGYEVSVMGQRPAVDIPADEVTADNTEDQGAMDVYRVVGFGLDIPVDAGNTDLWQAIVDPGLHDEREKQMTESAQETSERRFLADAQENPKMLEGGGTPPPDPKDGQEFVFRVGVLDWPMTFNAAKNKWELQPGAAPSVPADV